jgi:hypothetical protein
MPYTNVTGDQFEVRPNEVRHRPTGASFTSYPGLRKIISGVNWGRCGERLPSGEDYSRDEVEAVAKTLMAGQETAR